MEPLAKLDPEQPIEEQHCLRAGEGVCPMP